jgi:hypothetical protein
MGLMRVATGALAMSIAAGCGGAIGPSPIPGPARMATAGKGEPCDRAALARDIASARLRGHLGRLGAMRFELGGAAIAGSGLPVDETVPILADDGELSRIAVRGQGLTLLVWVDRADFSPVAMSPHRVSPTPGADPPADGLGVTVLPGHPVDGDAEGGWVRVRGHGLFAFDGWIPDDTGEVWEPEPLRRPAADAWVEGGSSLIDEADGTGTVLARLRDDTYGHLLESNALGADKLEIVGADARVVGYAVRPPATRRLSVSGGGLALQTAAPVGPPRCLYSEPGGAVVGLSDAVLDPQPADLPGWGLAPIATPWGEVVVAVKR